MYNEDVKQNYDIYIVNEKIKLFHIESSSYRNFVSCLVI